MTTDAYEEAKMLVSVEKKIHVLSSKNWVSGLIGLIAGKITQEYSRPSIAISVGETISKGSARSVDGVNIVEVIREFSDILIDVGGHPGAAGFSIETKYIEIFKTKIEKSLDYLPDEKQEILEIDAEIKTEEINFELIKKLKKFEPYGYKNPRPIFATSDMQISDIKTVGQGKHLKFKAYNIDAIAFGMGELESSLKNGQQIDLAYSLEINEFNGNEKLQLKVKDIVVK
jgi:single-stranded-DNA-specific exonuclease